ncbi:MAG: YwbE family protein [Pelolinea sp.]|nr:YwbE family protein [Pelolinea sp.]
MNTIFRNQIKKGQRVRIKLKRDQNTGVLNEGIVEQILTASAAHPHGIKVRLENGMIGRVKELVENNKS